MKISEQRSSISGTSQAQKSHGSIHKSESVDGPIIPETTKIIRSNHNQSPKLIIDSKDRGGFDRAKGSVLGVLQDKRKILSLKQKSLLTNLTTKPQLPKLRNASQQDTQHSEKQRLEKMDNARSKINKYQQRITEDIRKCAS